MQLKAIEKTNLVEVVEQKILNIVRKNNLSIGDSLPAELELTEGLGVSRSVVREALSRLRMLGLLESRKKRGMVIAEPDVFGGCSQVLDAAFLNEKTQRDLCEMRITLADKELIVLTGCSLSLLEPRSYGQAVRSRIQEVYITVRVDTVPVAVNAVKGNGLAKISFYETGAPTQLQVIAVAGHVLSRTVERPPAQ